MTSLCDTFRDDFPADVRSRGLDLFRQGAVQFFQRERGYWRGGVVGAQSFAVTLPDPQSDRLYSYAPKCGCVSFAETGICKHLWAALLEGDWIEAVSDVLGVDDAVFSHRRDLRPIKWASDAARREAMDPELLEHALGGDLQVAVEPSPERRVDSKEQAPSKQRAKARPQRRAAAAAYIDDDDDPELDADSEREWLAALRATLRRARGEPEDEAVNEAVAEADPRLLPGPSPTGDWRQRVAPKSVRLKRMIWARLPSGHRDELRYRLDEESLEAGELVLQPQWRTRRADGSFGGWRAPDPDRLAGASLAGEDLEILERYRLLKTGILGWSMSIGGVPVDAPMTDGFAALVRRGSVGRAGDGGFTPLTWRDGDWEPVFRIARSRHSITVTARLCGPDAGQELAAARAIVLPTVAFTGDGFVSFRFDGLLPLLEELLVHGPVSAPRAEEVEFLESLAARVGTARIEGLDVGDPTDAAAPPQPRAAIAAPDGRRSGLPVEIGFRYGDVVVGCDDPAAWVRIPGGDGWRRRDFEAEVAALGAFVAAGGFEAGDTAGAKPAAIPADRFEAVVRTLIDAGWEVLAAGQRVRRGGAPSIRARSGIDWFRIDGEVDFGDGRSVALPEVLAAAGDGPAGMVRLGDGSLGMLPGAWLERWRGLLGLAKADGDGFRIAANQVWLLDALVAAAEPSRVELDAAFAERRERLRSFDTVEPRDPPDGFGGELRDYQRLGLGWLGFLEDFELGGCLADDMGLGKTVQVLAHLDTRRAAGRADGPTLVVAPRSVVFNWCAEAARFAPRLRVLDWTGAERWQREADLVAADLVVTTYGTIRRDAPRFAERRFDYVILDEAQAIKNPHSQASKAVRALSARHRLVMTGTPVENHLGELWALFEFLNPGMLGRSKVFAELCRDEGAGAAGLPDTLRAALRPFLLRRTKEEVLTDLPEKQEQVIHCTLAGPQKREYEASRQVFDAVLRQKVDEVGLGRMKIHVLEALLRLRQLACHPGLVAEDRRDESSAKLDELLPRLDEIAERGHKALVFSQFTSFLDLVEQRLTVPYVRLDGSTAARQRQAVVRRFQEDSDCPVMLVSLKAGGTGLNLTAADYVFLLDPWWNPAVEAQAIDRAHRIGRTERVIAYRLIAKDTIEDRVLELQARKRQLADQLFAGAKGPLRGLTREDLELLVSA